MKEKAAGRRAGINAVGQASKMYPSILQFRYQRDEIAHAAA